ncbi:MAG: zinc-binding dehydrogenase, partial [Miltoncostaeaceae bacterium]
GAEPLPVTAGSFAPSVMSMTDGHGADVILDLVGARYLQDNIACLARHGRIVLTGLVGGRRGEADLGTLLARQGTITGSTLRGSTVGEKAEIMRAFADWALPLFNTGVLRPVVHDVLRLSEVARAHRIVEGDEAVGCVVLVP